MKKVERRFEKEVAKEMKERNIILIGTSECFFKRKSDYECVLNVNVL